MRLVFLGSPPFGTPILEALLASPHETAAVVTPPSRPRGRGRRALPSAIANLAEHHALPLLQVETTRDPDFVSALRATDPEVLVVASYGEILRQEILELAPHGALNVHASLLPRWRGASPIQRAILEGDAETGVSVQRMVLALDKGDLLLQERTPIGESETAGELLARLAKLGGSAIVKALDTLSRGEARFTPQDETAATYAPKLRKEDGWIDWAQPAARIERQVRAFQPWPGARCRLPDGRTLTLLRTRVDPLADPAPPGTLLSGKGMRVATSEGSLTLLEVKPEGKAAMDAAAFRNGARLETGTVLT